MGTGPNPYQSPQNAGSTTDRTVGGRRQRSTFWIVSTHVLTASMVMPLLAGILAHAVVSLWQLSGEPAFLVRLAFQAVGYIKGTYHSLSYLRKATAIRNPQRCTKASIITFVVLAVPSLTANIVMVGRTYPLRIAFLVVFYVVICFAFARITQKGFAQMADEGAEPESRAE